MAYVILRKDEIKIVRAYYLIRELLRIIWNIGVADERLSASRLAFTCLTYHLLFWYILFWITDRFLNLLSITFKKSQTGVWTWSISILNIINYISFNHLSISRRILEMQCWLYPSLSTWHWNNLIIYFLCSLRWI